MRNIKKGFSMTDAQLNTDLPSVMSKHKQLKLPDLEEKGLVRPSLTQSTVEKMSVSVRS